MSDAEYPLYFTTGRYRERPFRAAAHTLWRSLSVEWHDAGISIGLVAIAGTPDVAELAEAIAGRDGEPFLVELTDLKGNVLGW